MVVPLRRQAHPALLGLCRRPPASRVNGEAEMRFSKVRREAVKALEQRPEVMRMIPPTEEGRAAIPCWCGAKAGEQCRNAMGVVSNQHKTRGAPREVIAAIAKSSGLPWPR